MKKITFGIIAVLVLSMFSYKISFALFSNTATSVNNTFAAAAVFPSISPSITPTQCTDGLVYAVGFSNTTIGTKKDNSPITDPLRTDPSKMLGAPNWVSGTGSEFYALGKGGSVTLSFANPISPTGVDNLKIYEATNNRNSYPLEKAKIEVSLNGSDWQELSPEVNSEPSGDGSNVYDLTNPIKFVKLTETTDITLHDNTWDGVDIDGISGNIICEELN